MEYYTIKMDIYKYYSLWNSISIKRINCNALVSQNNHYIFIYGIHRYKIVDFWCRQCISESIKNYGCKIYLPKWCCANYISNIGNVNQPGEHQDL